MRQLVVCSFVVVLVALASVAALPPDEGRKGNTVISLDAATVDNTTYINANSILMFVTNHGNIGRDLAGVFGHDAGTFFPYRSHADILDGTLADWVLYAAGPWLGGKVGGEIRIAIAEYSDEYVPGTMAGGTYQPDGPSFRVYKLYVDSLESNPNDDYLNWPVDQGAPVDELGKPELLGDQMLWTVYNDADPYEHTNNAGNTAPLGIEIQQTVWAVAGDDGGEVIVVGPVAGTHVGPAMGAASLYVVDPYALTGDDYMVIFDSVIARESSGTW